MTGDGMVPKERELESSRKGFRRNTEAGSNTLRSVKIKAAVLAVILLILGLIVVIKRGQLDTGIDEFTQNYYPVGRQVLHGHLHYASPTIPPFPYPPFAALLVAPFAWMSRSVSATTWYLVEVLLLVCSAAMLASRICRGWQRPPIAGLLFVSFACFGPLPYTLHHGLIDIWILTATVGAFTLVSSPRPTTWGCGVGAGFLLGLCGAIKLYPFLTLLLILYVRRDQVWAMVEGAVVAVVASFLLPAAFFGLSPFAGYFHVLTTLGRPDYAAYPYAWGLLSIGYRAFVPTPYAHAVIHVPQILIEAVVLVALLVLVGYGVRRLRSKPSVAATWGGALLLTAVCQPTLEIELLTVLAIVPAILALETKRKWLYVVVFASLISNLAWFAIPGHEGQGISVVVSLLCAGYAWREATVDHWRWAVLSLGYVLTAAPGFLNFASQWGVPMSFGHVVLGSAEYGALLLFALPLPFGDKVPMAAFTWTPKAPGPVSTESGSTRTSDRGPAF